MRREALERSRVKPVSDMIRSRLRRPGTRPWLYAALIVVACGLRWHALTAGFLSDDYAQLGMLDGAYPLHRSAWNLFSFSDGTTAEGETLIQAGYYPWWADPNVRISMFRPLASAMIALDFRCFGNTALGYHIHSMVWWILLLGLIAWMFECWLPPRTALLSFAIVACANAHGIALAWICNRSAIVSTLLALMALFFHVEGRERLSRWRYWFSVAMFGIALGFGEYALCGGAYLFAYEIGRGPGALPTRLKAVLPYAIEALIYLCLRSVLDLGMRRSGVYVEAITEPVAFLRAIFDRAPVLVGDLLFALRSEYWTFGAPPLIESLRVDGIIPNDWFRDPADWRLMQSAIGVVACVLVVVMVRVQRRRQPNVQWLLLGAVLSLLPVCGSFPSSRLTLAALFGFTPLLASVVVYFMAQFRVSTPIKAILAFSFACYQIVVPAMQQWHEVGLVSDITGEAKRALVNMPVDEQLFRSQFAVVLAALDGGISAYLPLTRHRFQRSTPRACWTLSQVPVSYTLTRTQANGFTIRFHGPHTVLSSLAEQLLREPSQRFHLGEMIQIGGMRVTVIELFNDQPKALKIEFDRNIDDPSLLFLFPAVDGYHRFRMPGMGGSVDVPAPGMSSLPDDLIADR